MIKSQNFKVSLFYPLPREEWHGWEGCNQPLHKVICCDLREKFNIFIVVDGNEICVTKPKEDNKQVLDIWHAVFPSERSARLVARFLNPVNLKDMGLEIVGDIDNG